MIAHANFIEMIKTGTLKRTGLYLGIVTASTGAASGHAPASGISYSVWVNFPTGG